MKFSLPVPMGKRDSDLDPEFPKELLTGGVVDADADCLTRLLQAGLLIAFVAVKGALAISLELCKSPGESEYPFTFQTLLIFPFLAQVCFYTCQTMFELGSTSAALKAITDASADMQPALLYSTLTAFSTLLQTLSLSYIPATAYVVVMQLTLVFVALGDRFILKKPANVWLWLLVLLQAICVSIYQIDNILRLPHDGSAVSSGHVGAAKQLIGLGMCLLAETFQACGCILQQRFMQQVSKNVATSIKLLYQHLIGLAIMIISGLTQPSSLNSIIQNGFFYGWSSTAVTATVLMWLAFLASSTVTAYIGALAGSMAAAIVVVVVGAYGVMMNDDVLSGIQFLMILVIMAVSFSFAYLKDNLNKKLGEDQKQSKEGDAVDEAAELFPPHASPKLSTRGLARGGAHYGSAYQKHWRGEVMELQPVDVW
jgi:drug/metabolite transporter (DMT)-like permease